MSVLYIMSSGTPEQNLQQIFRVFDINSDGRISISELKKIVKDLSSLINDDHSDIDSQQVIVSSGRFILNNKEVEKLTNWYKNLLIAFNEMDENCDGEISIEEFIQVAFWK